MMKFWLTIRQWFETMPAQAPTTRMVIDRAVITMSDDEWQNRQRETFPRQRLQKRFR
jgi:hypothetical protein